MALNFNETFFRTNTTAVYIIRQQGSIFQVEVLLYPDIASEMAILDRMRGTGAGTYTQDPVNPK